MKNATIILIILFAALTGLLVLGCGDDVPNGEGSQTDADADTDADSDSNADSTDTNDTDHSTDEPSTDDSDPATVAPLRIEAECALDAFATECLEVTGTNSELPDVDGWGGIYPSLSSDGQVGYTNGGSWFAFANIDLSSYNVITLNYSTAEGEGQNLGTGFYIRLDSPDGPNVAFAATSFTDSGWAVYATTSAILPESATGSHTVYFVAAVGQINNGNVDWVEFSYDADAVPVDTDTWEDGSLLIEAECAIDAFNAACTGVDGSNSNLEDVDGWGGNYPSLSSTGQVGYTNGGSWIAFAGIDLTDFSKVTIHYTCGDGEGETLDTGFWIRLDAPDGDNVGILETIFTGGWDSWTDTTADLTAAATGVHTVYFVANYVGKNNGNIDWIRFHN
ncbi:MAG: carbohydrate-binding protein [Deltaproteobacteria bacterium]|nr:carbohydrate-binding protein [Deltaproteobacteria bacterium]MBN2673789.1 carbohydrate-binding protein [Deltaproteobacteria bacterium]